MSSQPPTEELRSPATPSKAKGPQLPSVKARQLPPVSPSRQTSRPQTRSRTRSQDPPNREPVATVGVARSDDVGARQGATPSTYGPYGPADTWMP